MDLRALVLLLFAALTNSGNDAQNTTLPSPATASDGVGSSNSSLFPTADLATTTITDYSTGTPSTTSDHYAPDPSTTAYPISPTSTTTSSDHSAYLTGTPSTTDNNFTIPATSDYTLISVSSTEQSTASLTTSYYSATTTSDDSTGIPNTTDYPVISPTNSDYSTSTASTTNNSISTHSTTYDSTTTPMSNDSSALPPTTIPPTTTGYSATTPTTSDFSTTTFSTTYNLMTSATDYYTTAPPVDTTSVGTTEHSSTYSAGYTSNNSSSTLSPYNTTFLSNDTTDPGTTTFPTDISNSSATSAPPIANSTSTTTSTLPPSTTPRTPSTITTTTTTTTSTTTAPLKCENDGIKNGNSCLCSDLWTGTDCSEENFCETETMGPYNFLRTAVGVFAYSIEKCEANTSATGKPKATARCIKQNNGSRAFEWPQVLNCSLTLSDIQLNLNNSVDLEQLATSTQILTSTAEDLTTQNVTAAALIANQLLKLSNTTENIRVSAIATVSQLLNASTSASESDATLLEENSNATIGLTRTLEELSLKLSKDGNSSESNVVQPLLVLQSVQVPATNTRGVQFTSFIGKSGTFIANRIELNLNTSQVDTSNESANALIYINLTTEGGTTGRKMPSNISLGFVLYQNDRFFRTLSYNKQRSSGMVLAGNVSDGVAPHHVEILFRPTIRNDKLLYDYACVSWDYDLEDWSTRGCTKTQTNNSNLPVGCFCNHTTNFAALWSYTEKYQYRYLDEFSMAGLIISAVALVITIVHHLKVNICKTARERQGNFHPKLVLLYIYTTLLVFILLFLSGSDNHHKSNATKPNLDYQTNNIPENKHHIEQDAGPCTAVTALLHYFLLATFMWNSIYGTQLVLLLRSLRSSLPPYWTRLSHIVGWGLPAVIMTITLGATYSVNNPLNYRQEEFCWLAGVDQNKQFDFAKPMFGGFLLPMSLILVYNAVLLVVTALTTCKIDPKLRSTKKTTLWKKFLVCFSLVVLLGLSWSLGYLVLVLNSHSHYVLSIIFCICQTTQGLQIFIFFTARTPSFRAALKHCGHTIASASLTRAQTYHLWENFKKALSFESYKKCENDKSECTTMSDMNRSATSVEKK